MSDLSSSARTGYDKLLSLEREAQEDSIPLILGDSEQEASGKLDDTLILEDRVIDVPPRAISDPVVGSHLNQSPNHQIMLNGRILESDEHDHNDNRLDPGHNIRRGRRDRSVSPTDSGRFSPTESSTSPRGRLSPAPYAPDIPSPLRNINDVVPVDHGGILTTSCGGDGNNPGRLIVPGKGGPGNVRFNSVDNRLSVPVTKRPRTGSFQSVSLAFDRWTRDIKTSYQNFKRNTLRFSTLGPHSVSYEIYYSVFKPPSWLRRLFVVPPAGLLDTGPVSRIQFKAIVNDVLHAIGNGIGPRRIAQGSSGSYFVYDTNSKVVAVFKPQDEEPYGKLSPKWTKWFHRNLFPCFFGRSCLIPNNGYICEAAASLLDRQLQTFIVPFTDTVYLSSPTFYYPYFDRRRYDQASRPLPDKIGSFQLFLHGYEQANVFLRKHPLPSNLGNDRDNKAINYRYGSEGDHPPKFEWTIEVLQQFREELEKLVIVDYLMRNTDRGLDNWMIKLEWEKVPLDDPFADPNTMGSSSSTSPPFRYIPRLRIGAIDSGLSWPWKHPDEWRSYPFGWLFLPLALIGQPFSKKTREHFLPILCSTKWWEESTIVFRELFSRDPDFKERMWHRQLAVLKGQAFNVVETLKGFDQGPLELARRTRCMVWDDEMEVPVSEPVSKMANAMETPLWSYHDEPDNVNNTEDSQTASSDVIAFPTIGEEEAMIESPQPKLNLTPAIAGSPPRKSFASRLNTLSPNQPKGGRKRGGSLALEARFNELQHGDKATHGMNLWEELVNSDLGEPADPSRTPPEESSNAIDNNEDHTSDNYNSNNNSKRNNNEDNFFKPTSSQQQSAASVNRGGRWDDEELGFTYATGHQATRKVIVERLQTVRSKPPVFTWC